MAQFGPPKRRCPTRSIRSALLPKYPPGPPVRKTTIRICRLACVRKHFAWYSRFTQMSYHFLSRVWPISTCDPSNMKRKGATTDEHDAAGDGSTMINGCIRRHSTVLASTRLDADEETHRHQCRGAADQAITQFFAQMLEAAVGGELDHWSEDPRSRFDPIIILDQFSRSAYRDAESAETQDAKALAPSNNEHYGRAPTVWDKTFFILPLAHSEGLAIHERMVALCECDDCRSTGETAQGSKCSRVAGARGIAT